MDAIQLQPMAGKDAITKDTIIARIQNPSPESKVGSYHSFNCRVKVEDPESLEDKACWYPDQRVEDAKSVELAFSLESAEGCAPRLRLTQDLRRKNEAVDDDGNLIPEHHGSIDLAFGRIYKSAEDRSQAPNQIFNLKIDYKQEYPTAKISFDTMGATANNLKCLIEFPTGHNRVGNLQLSSYERGMTTKLCSLATNSEGKILHVTILIQPNKKDQEAHASGESNAVDKMLNLLPFEGNVSGCLKKNMTQLSYYQYRNANHKPVAQYNIMPRPFRIYDEAHPCLPEPPRNAWQDADEALVRLATSVHVQHVGASFALSSLLEKKVNAKLLTDRDLVLLCITWDKPFSVDLSSDERITFLVGFEINANMYEIRQPGDEEYNTNDGGPFHVMGRIISNVYGLDCDALVAVDLTQTDDLAGLTAPLATSRTAFSYTACLTFKIAHDSCAAMINAVAKTYARESWVTKKWPALLNDGAHLAARDLATPVTCSSEKWHQALEVLNSAHEWDEAQRAHIDTFLEAPGGMALLTGSSGAGKTEVMLHLMRFCMQVDIKIICHGPNHATLDLMIIKYITMFPDEEPPLRIYAASIESVTTLTTERQADENEMLLLDPASAELAENKNKRSRLLSTHSIQHRVLENSGRSDMPPMKRKFPSGFENGYPIYTDRTLYDFREVFRKGLAALEEHPFSDSKFWSEKRFTRFQFAYAALRAEVVRKAKMLVGTLENVGSQEISEHFGQDAVIALFSDEAQASAEPPSLIAVASCKYSPNICVWAMYGDLEQSGVINPSGRKAEDTVDVFYKQSDMSLFLRLYLAGHPVDRLNVQWRQHEKLFKLLNELHYDMRIRTSHSMKGDLYEHTTLMGRIANIPDNDIAAQSDYQKRLLHVVVDSPTMRAKDSTSRANPGFAAYVVDIVLPKVRKDFGDATRQNVMLIVPYAKQKELYRRLFTKLRRQGWTTAQLPQLSTIGSAHGHEAHLVIFDVVNDDYEGFLQDKKRCCVAFSRAKEQMIVISGTMTKIPTDTTTRVVRDATNGDSLKTITLKRPLLHWASWFVEIDCRHSAISPPFEIPPDLEFYG